MAFMCSFYKIPQLLQCHERPTALRAHARCGIRGEFSMFLTSRLHFCIFSLFLPRKFLCTLYLHCLTFLDSWTPKIIPYGHFYGWSYCDKGQVYVLYTFRHFKVHISSYNFQSQFLLAEFPAIIIPLLSASLVTIAYFMPACVNVKEKRYVGSTPSFESYLVPGSFIQSLLSQC